jgi:GTP diphosphokinase / guanosine-3',5'-bis(diphosphate) 3'-diphosphatase
MKIQTEEEIRDINVRFNDLLSYCTHITEPEDIKLIHKAFHLANEAHGNMRRKSGEPYIIHPISVSKIVVHEIGLGAKSVISALLHDVVEDTEYSLDDIRLNFGERIAVIIDGLTKISGVLTRNHQCRQRISESFFLTLSDDVRVILIKLADRLDNMRTLDSMPGINN